jgi:hypothetical protein
LARKTGKKKLTDIGLLVFSVGYRTFYKNLLDGFVLGLDVGLNSWYWILLWIDSVYQSTSATKLSRLSPVCKRITALFLA